MILDKEEVFRIYKALHGLEEPYKEVFTLRVFGNYRLLKLAKYLINWKLGKGYIPPSQTKSTKPVKGGLRLWGKYRAR